MRYSLRFICACLILLSCDHRILVPPERPMPDPINDAQSQPELVRLLSQSYQTRDCALFSILLANLPDCNAEFEFLRSDGVSTPHELYWPCDTLPCSYDEIVRRHQHLFECEEEPGVPPHMFIDGVFITLTSTSGFRERPDLYASGQNPGGLDPAKFRATSARYMMFVLFDTRGQTDFLVDGETEFVVIEDLSKQTGEATRFLLLRWEDLRH